MALLYVSTTGSDSNLGTSGSPVKSISKAAQLARPGDTVLVDGGVYKGPVTINTNGTASAAVTFKPQEGEKVVIDGSGTSGDVVTISGDYVTFQGFEVRNSTAGGITLWDTHHTKVLDCNVHDNVRTGIYVGGESPSATYNNLLEGNEVWHNSLMNSARTMSGGWAMGINANSDGTIVRDNLVHHNYGEGIGVWQSIGGQVQNNRVHDNFSVNVYLDNAQGAAVQHNTIYHTYDTGFYRGGQPSHSILIGNEATGVTRPLPSKDIVITDNEIGGGKNGGAITYWFEPGAKYTSMGNATLSPNTIHDTPDSIINAPDDASGGTGGDPILGAAITGTALNDTLTGTASADTILGLGGNDKLDGGAGADTLKGGAGNDSYYVDNAGDVVVEVASEGTDTVFSSVSYALGANVNNLTLTGTAAVNATGDSAANTLAGNSAANTLSAGSGRDSLNGNGGADILTGGGGADTFYFDTLAEANGDRITDFTHGSDKVSLQALDANSTLTGDQAFAFIGTGGFSGTAGQLHYAKGTADTVVSGDLNGDRVADFSITFTGLHTFSASDFTL